MASLEGKHFSLTQIKIDVMHDTSMKGSWVYRTEKNEKLVKIMKLSHASDRVWQKQVERAQKQNRFSRGNTLRSGSFGTRLRERLLKWWEDATEAFTQGKYIAYFIRGNSESGMLSEITGWILRRRDGG